MIVILATVASKSSHGRPQRKENLKIIYLRKSVQEQWGMRENTLAYEKMTDSEGAKVLLQ